MKSMKKLLNHRTILILDVIIIVFALAVWQFKFEPLLFNVIIGVVVPSVIILKEHWKGYKNNAVTLGQTSFWTFYATLAGITLWPLGNLQITENVVGLILAAVVAFSLKPTIEFLTGLLFSFWIGFLFSFIQYMDGWKNVFSTQFLNDIVVFTYSSEGIGYLVSQYWWVYVSIGFLLSLAVTFVYEPHKKSRFLSIVGVAIFPVVSVYMVIFGSIYAVFRTFKVYVRQVWREIEKEGSHHHSNIQPAKKSYLTYKAFYDWKASLLKSLEEQIDMAGLFTRNVKNHTTYYGWIPLVYSAFFWFPASGVAFIVGSTLIILASIVHLALVGLFALPIYTVQFAVWSMDKGYRKWNKVKTLCPNCHHTSELPSYVCSGCSREHTLLVPSAYGIFKRTCTCGEKLPTAFFNGRANMEAKCSGCNAGQQSRESTPISIPIIGGPSVGKTCFMISATKEIMDGVAPRQSWGIRFLNDREKRNFDSVSSNLGRGMLPSKTTNGPLTAFNFFISHQKWVTDKMVYLYDPAGESFNELNSLKQHDYYENNHGNVFIIDPFSIIDIAKQYQKEQNYYNQIKPSDAPSEEILDRLMVYFSERYGIKPHKKIHQPVAFVINKVDAYNLKEKIGEKAAGELLSANPSLKTIDGAIHQLCYNMLKDAGMNNFLRKIDDKFSNYRFFASSAINSNELTSADKPILWLLSQADKDIKVSS
ncbi:hypothetical protein IMZ31_16820 [Pontibacillus sp. ALD_SL1]|uniref:TRAFAC clade GTPase domain-containing protein n=1 Tax=Pontibacillus sp. ALD_SL1 TaxID=2777185 RepID=UPI001A975FAA|nr:hypothetical protein [Pontibacillus sp. ALD_SL1]QSS99705.1 hypothetical protein IMZ31_16820 [Pontibacillus sp. ALD_SL1]